MPSIEALPNEILIKIFQLTDGASSLIKLTEVCKRFNDVISDEEKLTKKLTVQFSSETCQLTWIGRRKYENLKIFANTDVAYNLLLEKLKHFGNDIKRIEFDDFNDETISARILSEFLRLSPNVKVIDGIPHVGDENFEGAGPNFDLVSLKMNVSRNGFQLLANAQTQKFMIVPIRGVEGVQDFLKRQRGLTHLEFLLPNDPSHTYESSKFDDCMDVNFPFALETLIISEKMKIRSAEKFEEFLRPHAETLRLVDMKVVKKFSFLNVLKDLKNLRTLKFDQVEDRSWRDEDWNLDTISELTLNSVTELELIFYQDINFDIAEVFPNLRKLSLENSGDFKLSPIGEFLQLEELSLRECQLDHIPLSVKVLKFYDMNFDESPNFVKNLNVQQLYLEECSGLNWLEKLLKGNEVKFKDIEIIGGKLEPSEAVALEKHAKLFGNVECTSTISSPFGLSRRKI